MVVVEEERREGVADTHDGELFFLDHGWERRDVHISELVHSPNSVRGCLLVSIIIGIISFLSK